MRKALSLILAVVMVALMIPFAAFTTAAADPYSMTTDFTAATPDNGSTGNITANLPTGWAANDDKNTAPAKNAWPTTINYDWKDSHHANVKDTYEDEVKYIGVRLGGGNQGIFMTDAANVPTNILNGTTKHTITVKWNTTYKFANIRFGWSGDAATVPTADTFMSANQVAFNATGGPGNAAQFSDAAGGNFFFNNSTGKYATEILNKYNEAVAVADVKSAHSAGLKAGNQFTTTIEVVNGKVSAVYNEVDGVMFKYTPYEDVNAKGYLSIWIANWGDNNTANIQSVEIAEIVDTPETPEGPSLPNAADVPTLGLTLPEGWVISTDDAAGTANSVGANGVILGGDSQSLAMTTKVGAGEQRVIAIDFGIVSQIGMLHLTWEADKPSAGNVPQNDNGKAFGGNDLFLCMFGGPDLNPVADASTIHMKVSKSASDGDWLSNDCTGYVRATVDGTWTKHTGMKRWAPANGHYVGGSDVGLGKWTAVRDVLYDGACGTNGTKMVLYVELDANNCITGTYQQYVLYDANGNFVKEYVVYTANANTYKASCDGYLTIGHTAGKKEVDAAKSALAVKSVKINKGTTTNMGESIYSMDFQAWGAENPQTIDAEGYNDYMYSVTSNVELANGEASYRNDEDATGIRFTTGFNGDAMQLLVDLYENGSITKVEFGTLITLTPWAEAAGGVTHAKLDAVAGESIAYIEVEATLGEWYAENTFAGTVITENTTREYQAVGFAKITLATGKVVVVYSDATTATLAGVQA